MASNETSGPCEGYTKRTLPKIPAVPALTRIPLEPDSRFPPAIYTHTMFVPPAQCTPEMVLQVLADYNCHLGHVKRLDPERRHMLSQNVVDVMNEINRIGEEAQKQIASQVILLFDSVHDFASYARQGDLDFSNPSWPSVKHWVFREKVHSTEIANPEDLVQTILHSFPEAAVSSHDEDSIMGEHGAGKLSLKLGLVAERLVTLEGGQYHAFELCFSLKVKTLLGADGNVCPGASYSDTEKINGILLCLLRGRNPSTTAPEGPRERPRLDIDLAATSRKLWQSMQEHGCTTASEGPRFAGDRCRCHRATSYRLLHELQTEAYAQIRIKILITIGAKIPQEIFDPLLEFALIAEEIPEDPRVPKPDFRIPKSRIHRSWPTGFFQVDIKPEYRCPRFLERHS